MTGKLADDSTKVAHLKEKIKGFIQARDWEKFHNPKDVAMSISIEAGELMELFQWKTDAEIEESLNDPAYKEKVEDELADVITFCIAFANATGLDIATIIGNKLEKNHEKYPVEKAKGKNLKYTEL